MAMKSKIFVYSNDVRLLSSVAKEVRDYKISCGAVDARYFSRNELENTSRVAFIRGEDAEYDTLTLATLAAAYERKGIEVEVIEKMTDAKAIAAMLFPDEIERTEPDEPDDAPPLKLTAVEKRRAERAAKIAAAEAAAAIPPAKPPDPVEATPTE